MAENITVDGTVGKQVPLLGLGEVDPMTNLDKGDGKRVPLSVDISPYNDNLTITKGRIPDSYERLLGDQYHQEFMDKTTQKALHENQSVGGQFLNALGQTATTFLGQGIESIGYVADLRGPAMLADEGEETLGQLYARAGKEIQDAGAEMFPIYQDPGIKGFNPSEWSWWMANSPSVLGSYALMAVSGGVTKMLGAGFKAIGMAGKLGPMAEAGLGTLTQATVSRHMEGMMEAHANYDEVYKQATEVLGMSDEDATKKASISAAQTYKTDWAMLGMDIAQYALLRRAMYKPNAAGVTPKLGKMLGYGVDKTIMPEVKRIGLEVLGEGFEEGYQWMASEEGKYAAEKAFNPSLKGDFSDRVRSYLGDGDMWTNAFFGAIGGGVMTGMAHVGDKLASKGKDHQVEEVKTWGVSFKAAYEKMKAGQSLGDEHMVTEAQNELTTMLGVRGASSGMLDVSADLYDKLVTGKLSPETLQKLNIDPDSEGQLKTMDAAKARRDILAAGNKYLENLKQTMATSSKLSKALTKLYNSRPKDMKNITKDNYARSYAALLTKAEMHLEHLGQLRNTVEAERRDAESRIVNFSKLSANRQTQFLRESDIASLTKQREFIAKKVDDPNIDPTYKKDIDAQLKLIDTLISLHNKALEDSKKRYTKEEETLDNAIDIDSPAIAEFYRKDAIVKRLESSITSYQSAIDRYKKGEISSQEANDLYDKGLEEDEDYQEVSEVGDIVSWLDQSGTRHLGVIDKIDDTDDSVIDVQEIDKNYRNIGTSTIKKNKVDLDLIAKIEDTEIDKYDVEPIAPHEQTPDEQYREELENTGINKALSDLANSLATSHIDTSRPDKIQIRDRRLDAYSSDPDNKFEGAVATYTIDWKHKFWDEGGDDRRKFRIKAQSGRLTEKELLSFLSAVSSQKETILSELRNRLNHILTKSSDKAREEAKSDGTIEALETLIKYIESSDSIVEAQTKYLEDLEKKLKSTGKAQTKSDKIIRENFILLLSEESKTDGFTSLVDKLPISVSIKVAGQTFDTELYVHDSDFWNVGVPDNLDIGVSDEEWIEQQRENTRTLRGEIISNILKGNVVTTEGIDKLNGWFNIVKTNGNIHDRLGVEHGTLKLYVGVKGPGNSVAIQSSPTDIRLFGRPQRPGGIYITTNKTSSGKEVLLRLNPSKLSTEHAEILWDAIVARAMNGAKYELKDDRVKGVNVQEIINLLVLFGDRSTNPDNLNNVSKTLDKNKALYIKRTKESARTLFFGDSSVDLYEKRPAEIEANKLAFIEWATKYKNYRIPLNNRFMGLQLNSTFDREFKIGSLVNTADKPYSTIIMDTVVGTNQDGPIYMLSTNVDRVQDPTDGHYIESITHSPLIDINLRSIAVNKPNIQPAKVVKVEKPVVVAEKHSIAELKQLQDGTVLYFIKVNSVEKVPFGIIKTGPGGVKYIELTNGFEQATNVKLHNLKSLRLVKGNTDSVKELFDYMMTGSETIGYDTPQSKSEQDNNIKPGEDDIDTGDESLDDIKPLGAGKSWYPTQPGYTPVSEKELKWVYDKFGRINIEKTTKLIELAGKQGKYYFGLFRSDAILLFNMAPSDVLYHEAFHRVSLGYLSEFERQAVYSAARKRYELLGASDSEIEEVLADQFMEYKALAKELPRRAFVDYIIELYDFITSMFTGHTRLRGDDIDKLFDSIERGRYRYNKISAQNLKALEGRSVGYEIGGKDVPTIDNVKEMNNLVKALAGTLIQVNHINDLNDIKNLTFQPLVHYIDHVPVPEDKTDKGGLIQRFKTVRNKKAKQLSDVTLTPEAKAVIQKEYDDADHLVSLYESILNKDYWKIFVERINTALMSYNIVKKESDPEEEGDVNDYMGNIGKAAYEFNTKDNVLASIKFLIATLPASDKVNKSTFTLDHVDFNEAWSNLLFDLWDKDSIDEILTKLDSKSDVFYYKKLAEKLRAGDDILRIQFKVAMSKHKHMFINFLFNQMEIRNDNGERIKDEFYFKTARSDMFSAARIERLKWNEYLYESNLINKSIEGKPKINESLANDINKEYQQVAVAFAKAYESSGKTLTDKQFDEHIEALIPLFQRVGIDIDRPTVSHVILKISKEFKITKSEALNKFMLSDVSWLFDRFVKEVKNPTLSIRKLLLPADKDEKLLRYLSEAKYEVHPDLLNDSVVGPGGNKYFTYSQNTYLSDLMKKFSKDPNFIQNKISKIYNKNSLFLPQMLDGDVRDNLNLFTFSSFIQEDIGDSGKEYLGMNRIEDYLIKLYAFERGLVCLPTLADKSSYYFINGLKSIDFDLMFDDNGNYTWSDNVIDMFYGYAKDEKERKELAEATIKAYKNESDPKVKADLESRLIDNYHYVRRGDNLIDTNAGNAIKYHLFPSFNRENFDFKNAREEIRGILNTRLNEELLFANNLGLITGRLQENGSFIPDYNIYIDSSIISKGIENFGNETKAITNTIARNMVKTMQAGIEFGKLFVGDPAFKATNEKKGTIDDDYIKRLTGGLSTGDVTNNESTQYGVIGKNYTVSTMYTQKFSLEKMYGENIYQQIFDAQLDEYVKEYSKTPGYEDLATKSRARQTVILKQDFGINLKAMLKSYKEIDSTDGQAWISPDMYRSLSIRIGDWSPKKEEAFKLLQSDKELTKEEYITSLNVVLQPLKIVSFGLMEDGNLEVPLFDKMAMATIFRQMGHFGNKKARVEIMNLLDRMEGKGAYSKNTPVNMIKIIKVSKTGGKGGFNFYSNKELTEVSDFSNIPVFEQPYNLSRKQLVTDPHDQTRTKAGTQMVKIGMADILKTEAVYANPFVTELAEKGKITGDELINVILESTGALSAKGLARLKNRLGFENGKINKKALIDMLKKDSIKSATADLIVDAFKMEGDQMYLDLDAFPNKKYIFARLISLFGKEIIDLKLPGNQFIQVSNLGMRVNADSDLKWTRVKDGKLKEMECYVSINLFKHVIPNYEELTFAQKREFIMRNADSIMGYRIPTQGQNSVFVMKIKDVYPETIGDTITLPAAFTSLTGSDFDIDKVYVMRYNYKIIDNQLHKVQFHRNLEDIWTKERMPKYHWVYKMLDKLDKIENNDLAAAGGPEKISRMLDSLSRMIDDEMMDTELKEGILYILDVNLNLGEWDAVEYGRLKNAIGDTIDSNKQKFMDKYKDETDPYVFNPREAVENLLMDAYQSVYMSMSHVRQTTTPLGASVDMMKDLAKEVHAQDETIHESNDLVLHSPSKQSDIKFEYTGGKDGIGPFALNNVHHVLAQIADLKYRGTSNGLLNEDENGNIDLSKINGKDGLSIMSWLSSLIDIHVDVAKDPFVTWLNLNGATYDITALLIRGGFGLNTFKFISQPILKEFANLLLDSSPDSRIKRFPDRDAVVKHIKATWGTRLTEAITKSKGTVTPLTQEELMTSDEMMSSINNQKQKANDVNYIAKQLQYLDVFLNLSKAGKHLNELIQASQIDTKKFGNSMTSVIAFKNRIDDVVNNGKFINVEKMFSTKQHGGVSFLGPYYDNFLRFTLEAMADLTIYSTPVFNKLLSNIIRDTKVEFAGDKKLIDVVADELMGAIAGKFFHDEDFVGMNPEKLTRVVKAITNIMKDIKYAKNPQYKQLMESNGLLKILNNAPVDVEKDLSLVDLPFDTFLIVPNKDIADKFSTDELMYAWRDLFDHPDQKIKDLARLLMYYSYFTSGFRNRLFSFHNYLPPSKMKNLDAVDPKDPDRKIQLSYNEFIKIQRDLMSDENNYLMFQFLEDEIPINNWANSKIVPRVSGRERVKGGITWFIGDKQAEHPTAVIVNKWNNLIGNNALDQPLYTKYLTTSIKVGATYKTYLLKYIGFITETIKGEERNRPVYKVIPKRSWEKGGLVIKEYLFDKSTIPSNNISFIQDNNEVATLLGKENLAQHGKYSTFVPVNNYELSTNTSDAQINIMSGEVVGEVVEKPVVEEDTNKSAFQLQSDEGILATEQTIKDLTYKLADRIGFQVEFINNKDIKWKGRISSNNTIKINLAHATLDTPVHEIFGHPVIREIKKSNKFLYDKLIESLQDGVGKKVFERIQRTYVDKANTNLNDIPLVNEWGLRLDNFIEAYITKGYTSDLIADSVMRHYPGADGEWLYFNISHTNEDYGGWENPQEQAQIATSLDEVYEVLGISYGEHYDLEDQQEEALVELLGLMTAKKLDEVKDRKLIDILRQLLKEISAYIRSLLKTHEINVSDLPDEMTINTLANLFAYTNSKIILPGYQVKYMTPDGLHFNSYEESSRHITELAKRASEVDLSKVSITPDLTPEEQKKIDEFNVDIDKLKEELNSTEYKVDKFWHIDEIEKKLSKLDLTPVFSIVDEPSLNVPGFDYSRVQNTDSPIRTKDHKEELGDYHGYYIFGYNTSGDKERRDKKYIEKISEERARQIWDAQGYKSPPMEINQEYINLTNDLEFIKKDIRIMNQIAKLQWKINDIKKGETGIKKFIKTNAEHEKSKSIIEQYIKDNKIVYDPEEVYSRGQGFYSVIGAYSSVDLNLLMQNLLVHLEDHKKLGEDYIISAFTDFVKESKRSNLGKLNGSSARFVIYPRSENIKWAASTDVYSGSTAGAANIFDPGKRSEMVGVSYSKYPTLQNVASIQPNLANIIDKIQHVHNELGIVLTGNNFRIEYDDGLGRESKRLIDVVNSVLDQKYGKIDKPNITEGTKTIAYRLEIDGRIMGVYDTKDEAIVAAHAYAGVKEGWIDYLIKEQESVGGKQPNKTSKDIKVPIQDILSDVLADDQKKYVSEALKNLKLVMLKSTSRKYQRTLIRESIVRIPTYGLDPEFANLVDELPDLPFQKVPVPKSPESVTQQISQSKSVKDVENILLGYKGIIGSKRWRGKIWLKAQYEWSKTDHNILADQLVAVVNAAYPGLLAVKHRPELSRERGVWEVIVNELAWEKHLGPNKDKYMEQGTLFKGDIHKELNDIMHQEVIQMNEFFSKMDDMDISDPFEYINQMESFFKKISPAHRDMFELIRDIQKFAPRLKIYQITKSDVEGIFDNQEDISKFKDSLAFITNGSIYIVRDSFNDESTSMLIGTALHEIIHAFTLDVYYKYRDKLPMTESEKLFIDRTVRLFHKAKARTKFKDEYAYSNGLGEWLADGITDQKIIDELKTMRDEDTKLSFWQKFKQFMAELFGRSTHPDSYHAQLLSATLDFVYKRKRAPSGVDMIQARKISDNIYINKDNPTHKNITDALEKTETAYEALTEKFEGVTLMMKRILLGGVPYDQLSEEDQAELDKFSGPGIETHYQIEKSFKSAIKEIEHKYHLSQQASDTLNRYFDKFKKTGVTILSEVKVVDWKNKMVGKIDLVVIDENNKVHFFDFKTKINGFENFDVDYYPKKGEPSFFPFSVYKQATMQLTAYANMWEEITKTNVDSMHVIPLKPFVNQATGLIERYELDKSFNGKDIIDVERDSLWVSLLYSNKTITMNKWDNQDVFGDAENKQMREETGRILKTKLENLNLQNSVPSEEFELFLKIVKSLEHTIDISSKRLSSQKVKEQNEWLSKIVKLGIDDVEKALSYTVEIAERITRRNFNELKKLKDSKSPITPAILYRFKDSVSAWNVIDEYQAYLVNKHGANVSKMKEYDKINTIVTLRNAVVADYTNIGLELMVEYLYPFYTKARAEFRDKYGREYRELRHEGKLPNPNLTEKEYVDSKLNQESDDVDKRSKIMIRKELKKAAQDISTLEYWIDNILDSPDSVTAALVKAFVMYDDTARIEMERTRLEMLPIVRKFQEYNKEFGHNYEKSYGYMLEKDLKTGELTGHIVSRFHSSLMKEYMFLLKIANAIPDPEIRRKFLEVWKSANVPRTPEDKIEYNKAYGSYIEELYSTDKISEEERANLIWQMSGKRYRGLSFAQMREQGKITDNTEDLVTQWVQKNSWSYRTPAAKWHNPQWDRLQNILKNGDDPRSLMYNMIVDTQERADDLIPTGIKLHTQLPGVIKQKHERLSSGQSLGTMAKGEFSKAINFKVDDTHRVQTELLDLEGNARYFVPVHFTGRVTKKIKDKEGKEIEVFDKDEQSFDLANIYYNYLTSAIDFNWKNNILPEMELHKFLLNNREIVRRDPLGNILYRASKHVGGNKSELDEATIKGGNIARQFDTWLLYALYGQAEKDLGVIPGTNIDAGKLVDNIQRYTALNLLGLNVVAGVANLGLGEILQGIEAFAGKHIGVKEYHHAQAFYMKNFPGVLGDIGSLQPENIVSLLLREYNVLHDPKRRNLTDERFRSLMTMDAAFFTNHIGEHKMQTTFLLAALARARAYNSKGEDMGSVLDNYEVKDGVLAFKDGVDPSKTQWGNLDMNPQLNLDQQRRVFEHYVRGLLGRIHGDYSDLARVALQQNAIGAMAYTFRKFVVPGFRRRWGSRRYEERTQEFTEGNYRTTMRFVGNLYKSLRTQRALILSKEWAMMSDSEKANIIRTIGEVVALISVWILANVAIKMKGDDDKEGDLAWNFMAYQMLRLKSELLFFISPPQAMKILRSPAASLSVLENTIKLFSQTLGPGWEPYKQGPWKDHLKIEKTVIDMTIGVRQYYRLRDVGEQVDLWKI